MKKVLFMLSLLIISSSLQASVHSQLRQGGKLYNAKKYGSALNVYQNILREHQNDQRALFNAANAYYRLNEYTQAEELYKKAAEISGKYGQSALYNLGNAYYHAGDKTHAIEAYQKAILQNPKDKEAIHNLQLIIQEQQNQKNNNQNNQDNQDDKSDNQQSKDQQNNKGQSQQQSGQNQPQEGQLSQQDADRVMSMAKESEYKPGTASNSMSDSSPEKDW